MTKTNILNLGDQLRCPKGKEGKELGYVMNESNKGMIIDSIALLRIKDKNRILEIGSGNAAHLELVMRQSSKLRYFGLDISQTMVDEAKKTNDSFVAKRKALFQKYNGLEIPYVHDFFDRVLSVNSIYFWKKPKAFLTEIYRVLKPGGVCVITFVDAEFMKELPFVNETFRLYDVERMKKLIGSDGFELSYFQRKKELAKSKSGEWVDRGFTISILKKEPKILETTFE